MEEYLAYPFDWNNIQKKQKKIKNFLLDKNKDLLKKNIAIMGGSSTNHIAKTLELFCIKNGIKPNFYESEFGQFYEEIIYNNQKLINFKPDLVIIHTNFFNLNKLPQLGDSKEEVDHKANEEYLKFKMIWKKLANTIGCHILQNNFEFPLFRPMGDLDSSEHYGVTNFVNTINAKFAKESNKNSYLTITDINYLSSRVGIENWFNPRFWTAYRYFLDFRFMPLYCNKLASKISAFYGIRKKVVITDLDNTIWNGVVGDDGTHGIRIGNEDPVGEGYVFYQKYLKSLKQRGILLAVASKNEEKAVIEGFQNPGNILSSSDFVNMQISWGQKSISIDKISKELNLGINSFIFIDDSEFEKKEVKDRHPSIEIPKSSNIPFDYINFIDQSFFFETHEFTEEDVARNSQYKNRAKFESEKQDFKNYDEFLKSLNMSLSIFNLDKLSIDRITQLINKTNQFNLTSFRLTKKEVLDIISDKTKFAVCARLNDKFGDHGIISFILVSLEPEGKKAKIDNWVMSCRVFNRGIEKAIINFIINKLNLMNFKILKASYIPSGKNKYVLDLFENLQFNPQPSTKNKDVKNYELIIKKFKPQNNQIDVQINKE